MWHKPLTERMGPATASCDVSNDVSPTTQIFLSTLFAIYVHNKRKKNDEYGCVRYLFVACLFAFHKIFFLQQYATAPTLVSSSRRLRIMANKPGWTLLIRCTNKKKENRELWVVMIGEWRWWASGNKGTYPSTILIMVEPPCLPISQLINTKNPFTN